MGVILFLVKEDLARFPELKKMTRSLRDVVLVDYFATHKIIRGILETEFDARKYDFDMIKVGNWINRNPAPLLLLSLTDLPEYVKEHRFTIGLYLELRDEVVKQNPLYLEPVAFDIRSKESREEIYEIKGRLKENGLKNADLKSFVIFLKYWGELTSRAKILRGTLES